MVATILVNGIGTLQVYTDRRLAAAAAVLSPPVTLVLLSTFDKLRHDAATL